MAVLPELSTAMLDIKRYKPSPALVHVCCCTGVAGKCAAGHINLIPANTCWLGAVRVLANSARRPERFSAATVLINKRSHDFIAKGIDVLGRSQLRHDRKASATRECVDEWVNRDLGIRGMVRANAESGICRGGKIDMKEPGVDLGQGHAAGGRAINGQKHFVPARRRRIACAKGRANEAIRIAHTGKRNGKGNGVSRTASEHRRAIERESAHSDEGGGTRKQVDREEIGILSGAPADCPTSRTSGSRRVGWCSPGQSGSRTGPRGQQQGRGSVTHRRIARTRCRETRGTRNR